MSLQISVKYCPNCNRTLSIDNFYKSNTRHDKLMPYCKRCHCLHQKERRLRKKAEGTLKAPPKYKTTCLIEQNKRKMADEAIRQSPELCNNAIAERVGVTMNYIKKRRRLMEEEGAIPFFQHYFIKDGRRRKRLLRVDAKICRSLIYFIQMENDPTGPVKIGYSNEVSSRIQGLQVGPARWLISWIRVHHLKLAGEPTRNRGLFRFMSFEFWCVSYIRQGDPTSRLENQGIPPKEKLKEQEWLIISTFAS
jgi:hypothetical protein